MNNSFRWSKLLLSLCLAIALFFGTLTGAPLTALAGQQGAEPAADIAPEDAVNALAATLPIQADVLYARSGAQAETVVSVQNTSDDTCQVEVEWVFGSGSNPAGLSGPLTLSPETTLEFVTANRGEIIRPYAMNAFRDTTREFEGGARIRSDCTALAANATLVTGISEGVGSSYTSIEIASMGEEPIANRPNDPRYSEQYGYENIGMPAVWGTTAPQPANQVTVAVIDTGVRENNHPDLPPRSTNNARFLNSGSDIGTGLNAADTPERDSHHGTHVAGTIAAVTNNETGVAGTLWNANGSSAVDLMSVRVLEGPGGSGTFDDIVQGIYYAAGITNRHGLKSTKPAAVINMSLGGSGVCSPTLENAIKAAVEAGSAVIVSGGNSGNSNPLQPASCPSVTLTVGATDSDNQLASFSSFGANDISAPGVDILSTWRNPDYRTLSGTSMASPHVAGAAAVLLSKKASLTPEQIKTLLVSNAEDFGDARMGAGILRVPGAFESASSASLPLGTSITTQTSKRVAAPGEISPDADFVPGEILVKYKEPAREVAETQKLLGGVAEVKRTSVNPDIPTLIRLSAANALSADGTEEQRADLKQQTLERIAELNASPDVDYAEPNYIFTQLDRA